MPVKQMFIDWQKFLGILSINVWLKEFHLQENMVVCWTTVLLEELKYKEHFMLLDKQVSNYFLELILPFRDK